MVHELVFNRKLVENMQEKRRKEKGKLVQAFLFILYYLQYCNFFLT